jgi:hypothetical protein
MALSPNYGWTEPDNTGLVKNGAQDMRTLGDAIDASVWNVGFGQAGKNKIINGDFGIWQRGTSFSLTTAAYTADRFRCSADTSTTFSRQAFTAGTAPVAGYESSFFLRAATGAGTSYVDVSQPIEDVRTFAGQTATFSFWAKANSATTLVSFFRQSFGSGGSVNVDTAGSSSSLTTSWQRFTFTVAIPSISGKTIGTGSALIPVLYCNSGAASKSIDIWGVQLERGSKATPFQTASGGSQQAELAMCQRYYQKSYAADSVPGSSFPGGYSFTIVENNIPNNNYYHYQPLIVQTRVAPTITIYSGSGALNRVSSTGGGDLAVNSAVAAVITDNHFSIQNTSGGALTASAGGFLFFYVASAEL